MNRIDLYNELILRENVRKALRIVQKKRQGILTEEQRLRNIVRSLLKEDADTEGPSMNTGGNALDQMLLNTNTLDVLESEYKTLTTSPEQRLSFRAHIINAAINSLAPERVSGLPNAAEETSEPTTPAGGGGALDELTEAVKALFEAELSIGDRPEEEVEASAPTAGPAAAEEEEADPVEAEREEFAAGVEGGDLDKTGRNYALDAWNKVTKNVVEAYAKLGNDEDREQYYDYLITNLKLYFDTWEQELEGTPEEPTTPEYEQEKEAQPSAEAGGEELGGMPEEGGEEELDLGF